MHPFRLLVVALLASALPLPLGCGSPDGEDLFGSGAAPGTDLSGRTTRSGAGGREETAGTDSGGSSGSPDEGGASGSPTDPFGGVAGDPFGGGGAPPDTFGGGPDTFGGGPAAGSPTVPGGGTPSGKANVACLDEQGQSPTCSTGFGCCLIDGAANVCSDAQNCAGPGVFGFMGCDSPDDCLGGQCCINQQTYESSCRSQCGPGENRMCRPTLGSKSLDCFLLQQCVEVGQTQIYFECK